MRKSVLRGLGAFLPRKVVSNDDLSLFLDTTDEWVFKRTGIKRRRLAEDGDTASTMAVEAARSALNDAAIAENDVNLIIVATSTPDKTLPSCATIVQGELGCARAFSFDINAACSGFVYAISLADSLIKTGKADIALVIGAEVMSRIVDWKDRSTCVLFGDGAGAFVLQGVEGAHDDFSRGVISTVLHSDGALTDVLYTDGGVGTTGAAGHVCMKGSTVFEHAVGKLSVIISELLESSGLSIAEVTWFVPHQANVRIIDSVIRRLNFPKEKVILGIEEHANTSAASIPLAMCMANVEGKFKSGDIVLLAAIGAGLTWGASLIRL